MFKNIIKQYLQNIIIKHIHIDNDNNNVLDTSSADGVFLNKIANIFDNNHYCGIDIDSKNIQNAKKFPYTFIVSNNKKTPFIDNFFDIIISSLTLHHINDINLFLNECKRILNKNGEMIIIDFIPKSYFMYKILNFYKCNEPYYFEKYYQLKELIKILEENHFKIKKQIKIPFTAIKIFHINKSTD